MIGASLGFVQDEIKPETFSEIDVREYQSERSVVSFFLSHNSLDQMPYPNSGTENLVISCPMSPDRAKESTVCLF